MLISILISYPQNLRVIYYYELFSSDFYREWVTRIYFPELYFSKQKDIRWKLPKLPSTESQLAKEKWKLLEQTFYFFFLRIDK